MAPEEPGLDERETEADPGEPEVIEREIPNPRTWLSADDIREHVEDIESVDRFRRALSGVSEMDAGPLYGQVMSVLTAAGKQAKTDLVGALARELALEEPEEGTVTVFEAAGRARAYGQERPPPASV